MINDECESEHEQPMFDTHDQELEAEELASQATAGGLFALLVLLLLAAVIWGVWWLTEPVA